jgi:hypothetical protein
MLFSVHYPIFSKSLLLFILLLAIKRKELLVWFACFLGLPFLSLLGAIRN